MDAGFASRQPRAPTPHDDRAMGQHGRLWMLRCGLWLLQRASHTLAPLEELQARFPALSLLIDAAAACGCEGLTLEAGLAQLDRRLTSDASGVPATRPLDRMREALQLDGDGMCCFLLCALCDEEPLLAPLIDALRGHDGRPTRAMLADTDGCADALNALLRAGFLQEEQTGRFRVFGVPPAVWQAVYGVAPSTWKHTALQELPRWDDLILPPHVRMQAQRSQGNQRPDAPLCWGLRASPGSGRGALAAALARSAGNGLLEVPDDASGTFPTSLAAIAILLGAMPLLSFAPAPGERAHLPALPGLQGPVAVRLPRHGGLVAEGRQLRWLNLPMPDAAERRQHWRRAVGQREVAPALTSLRVPRGSIHSIAASLAEVADYSAEAVMAELEAQSSFRLDGLAQRVAALGPEESLALNGELQEDFDALLARCRHRETLRELLPGAFGHTGSTGVRALLKGPSGTGKTLAARQLAAALSRPLYRVDLAATVSKYIGETERNLERVFGAAEMLDIVLLLDEGDALMAGRTGVSNANDRYANLETNYLLQRLESYDGILLVTTNAADRIDAAFSRRMDMMLEFALPDAQTRHRLWSVHLPREHDLHAVLDELSLRCVLSGGQIRNAALHAALLGLESRRSVGVDEMMGALRREYRRAGQSCPSLSFG